MSDSFLFFSLEEEEKTAFTQSFTLLASRVHPRAREGRGEKKARMRMLKTVKNENVNDKLNMRRLMKEQE